MVALKMGMFGRGPNLWDTPPIYDEAVPDAPFGRAGGEITAAPPKAGFFDAGGMGVRLLGGISDGILGLNGMAPVYGPSQDRRMAAQQQQQQYQQRRQDEQSDWMAREQYKIAHPGKTDLEERIGVLNAYKSGLGDTYAENYAANGGGGMQVVTTPQGTFMVPKAPAAPAPSGPAPGTVEGGYRFKGGNAGDPTAWEPVGGAGSQAPRPFR